METQTRRYENLLGRTVEFTASGMGGRWWNNGDIGVVVEDVDHAWVRVQVTQSTSEEARLGNGAGGSLPPHWNVDRSRFRLINTEVNVTETTTVATNVTPTEPLGRWEQLIGPPNSSLVGRKVRNNFTGRMPKLSLTMDTIRVGIIERITLDYNGSYYVKFSPTDIFYITPDCLELWVEDATITTEEVKKAMTTKAKRGAKKAATPKLTKKQAALAALEIIPASKEYVRILCAQIGVDSSAIPEEVARPLYAIKAKSEINAAFFAWHNSPKAKRLLKGQEIDAETLVKLEKVVDVTKTNVVLGIRNNIDAQIRSLESYYSEINNCNARIVADRLKLDEYSNAKKFNMAKHVQDIIKSGWFTFEKANSVLNGSNNNAIKLAFSTKDINIKNQNKELGINVDVDLGSYFVYYYPYMGKITVTPRTNNIIVGQNYPHPHISGLFEGSICWGNAAETYAQCMREFNPTRAFEAFQSLVQAYGGNPYKQLSLFAEVRDSFKPIKDETGNKFSLQSGHCLVLRTYLIPSSINESLDEVKKDSSKTARYFKYWTHAKDGGIYTRGKNNGEYVNLTNLYNNGLVNTEYY